MLREYVMGCTDRAERVDRIGELVRELLQMTRDDGNYRIDGRMMHGAAAKRMAGLLEALYSQLRAS